jgi:hypothetical protein
MDVEQQEVVEIDGITIHEPIHIILFLFLLNRLADVPVLDMVAVQMV